MMSPSQDALAQKSEPAERPSSPASREQANGKARVSTWIVRIAFLAVFIVNVHCALSFVLFPDSYAAAYELEGVAGNVAIQGLGIAFLMWNATYPAFIAAPDRFRVLGWVILAQQAIGLVGETALLLSLPIGHDVLASSITRFIAFDAAGLILMLAALIWYRRAFSTNGTVPSVSQKRL